MTSNRYPAPQDPTWMLRGICANEPDLMSPREDDVKGIKAARGICGNCPVRQDCLNSAMTEEIGKNAQQRDGVRGGYTPSERYAIHRNRPKKPRELKPCGTRAAYDRHRRNGETPCDDCRDAANEQRRQKEAAQQAKQKPPAKCGTMRGYRVHRRRGEDPCKACSAANAERVRQVREKNAGKPKAPRKPRPAWAKKPGPAAKPIEHGTEQGVHAHKNRDIPICDECRPVRVAMQREYRARLRAATERARHGLAA